MLAVNHVASNDTTLEGEAIKCLIKGKRLIVEFVGPPGGGKTTNCLQFLEFFKKRNINAYTFVDIKAYLYRLGLVQRLQIYVRVILLNGFNLLSYGSLLMRHKIYSLDAIYRYIKLSVFNRALHQFIQVHDVDVLFLDQWIIQGLWSATIFRINRGQELQDELKRFYFKTDFVLYFDIDEDTACDRIHLRDAGRSRFDKMDKGRRLLELKRNIPYLYRLYENSNCQNKFKFSTKRSPHKNAEDFFHQMGYSLSRE